MRKPIVKKDKVVITPQPPKDSTTTTSKEAPTATPTANPAPAQTENPTKEVAANQLEAEEE